MERTIELNATKETVIFIKTTEETNGEFVEMIVSLRAGGKGPGPHIHHLQTETFEVLEGHVGLLKGIEKIKLKPNETAVIEPNVLHDFWTEDNTDINGNWKLHTLQRAPVNYGKQIELDSPELYHLQFDISEKHDVAEQHPEKVEELLRSMEAHNQEALEDALPDNLVARIKD